MLRVKSNLSAAGKHRPISLSLILDWSGVGVHFPRWGLLFLAAWLTKHGPFSSFSMFWGASGIAENEPNLQASDPSDS